MMDDLEHAKLTFIDGAAVDQGEVELYLACSFTDINIGKSRMLLLRKDGKWGHHDVSTYARSVDISNNPFGFFALGKDGVVSIGSLSQISFEFIDDAGTGAGKLGYVKRIKNIGENLYVCGDLHQVYQRKNGSWAHMDNDIIIKDPRAVGVSLNDIDGLSDNDIYTVGDRGVIYHFDGAGWEKLESPTNCNLERVLCSSSDEIYITGGLGTLLRGNKNGWKVIHPDNPINDTIWGVAKFQNCIYLSTNLQLYKLNGDVLEAVDTGIPVSGSYYRLTASKTKLWSIGVNDISAFDGSTWSQVIYPDNI